MTVVITPPVKSPARRAVRSGPVTAVVCVALAAVVAAMSSLNVALPDIARQIRGRVARELQLSLKTVQNHVSHVLAKLQVRDRTQAAFRARGL